MKRLFIVLLFALFMAVLANPRFTALTYAAPTRQEATPVVTTEPPVIIVAPAWTPYLLTIEANTSADFNLDPGDNQTTLRVLNAGSYPVEYDANNTSGGWLHIRMSDGVTGYVESAANVTLEPQSPAPTPEPTEPPVVEPPAPVPSPDNLLAIVMVVVSVGGMLVSVALSFKQHGNLQQSYNELVQGIVSNAGLTNTLQAGYAGLQPDQKQWADLGLSLVEALSRATPDTRDDILTDWTRKIRDMATIQAAMKKG